MHRCTALFLLYPNRMDASKITELLQKQNTRYISRNQCVDSSTMTWMNTIQSSKYIKGVTTCSGDQNTNVPTQAVCSNGNGTCNYGGQGKQMTLMTGSTQQYPSVFQGAAGSAAEVYSSEIICLQQAGRNLCAGMITPQDSYTILPPCYAIDTNGPTSSSSPELNNPTVPGNSTLTGNPDNLVINNQSNPYLPAFDTFYRFKTPCSQMQSRQDQNAKHFVKQCHSRFPNADTGVNVFCTDCSSPPQIINGQRVVYPPYNPAGTCDGCVLEPDAVAPPV